MRNSTLIISTLMLPMSLKLVVAQADPAQRRLAEVCTANPCGLQVVGEAMTGTDLIRMALAQKPDVVVFDVLLPHCNGLDALRRICEVRPVAAVAITEERNKHLVQSLLEQYHL